MHHHTDGDRGGTVACSQNRCPVGPMKSQRQSWGEAERPALWLCQAEKALAGEPLQTVSSLERGQQGLLEVELQTRAVDEDEGACILLPPGIISDSSRPARGGPVTVFSSFIFGLAHSTWKFPGQGSNLCHRCNTTRSLTQHTTWELPW